MDSLVRDNATKLLIQIKELAEVKRNGEKTQELR